MPSGPVLAEAGVGVSLDGQLYMLARQEATRAVLGPTGRRWQVTRKATATKREQRSDVRPGDIPGEWSITWDDWSRGASSISEPLPGTVHRCDNIDPSLPGAIRSTGFVEALSETTRDTEADPAGILEFNGQLFIGVGRHVTRFDDSGGTPNMTVDKDFGAGVLITDMIVHNSALLVCFGGTTTKIWSRNTSGTWAQASDAVYANYFAEVENRLWRATATNQVGNIGPTDNPLTLTNWSTGISIGTAGIAITDLNAYGERLAVSKTDGLYLGDAGAVFPNVLPQMVTQLESDNGKGTLVVGSRIFYPYFAGLLLYDQGSMDEVGIARQVATSEPSDDTPGWRVTALASQGEYIWAATDIVGAPFGAAYFLKTTDSPAGNDEGTFTSYTTAVGDHSTTTYADLSSLSTAANGDYFYLGNANSAAVFYGAYLGLAAPNGTASILSAEFWNGSAWAAFGNAGDGAPIVLIDETSTGGVTLRQAGKLHWREPPTNWATKTINSITTYWIRFKVSVALDSSVSINEVSLLLSRPSVRTYRGRLPQQGADYWSGIVWEPFHHLAPLGSHYGMSRVTAMMTTHQTIYPFAQGGALICGARNVVRSPHLPVGNIMQPLGFSAGRVEPARHDGGTPTVDKQWLDITLRGRNFSAFNTIDVYYRVNEATTWTLLQSNATASGTAIAFSSLTGKALQWRLDFDVPGATSEPTEINEVIVRYRELPTYKSEFTLLLEMYPGQFSPAGGSLPHPAQQLTALRALHGGSPITLVDPTGTEFTVMVQAVDVQEITQSGVDFPTLQVQVKATEI